MGKFIRFSLLLIIIVIMLVLTLAFVEPHDVTVTRGIVIRASKEQVFGQIVNFNNWNNWYILQQRDTSVKITVTGSGEQGSTYGWVGDEHLTGEGVIKNEGVDSTSMRYTFTLTKPGEMHGDGYMAAEDSANLTKVVWTFHKHFSFPANAVLVVFNLDKYIGGDFDAALANLKQYVEKTTIYKPPVAIKEITYAGHLYAGIRQTVNFEEVPTFFAHALSDLGKQLGTKANGNATGLYYTWDTAAKRADIMAALPVADSSIELKGAVYMWQPPSKAYTVVYKGPYSGIGAAYGVMDKYLIQNNKASVLKVEEYLLGPMQEADSTKWITNVYYLTN